MEDITHIITHRLTPIEEELSFRFEVTELQHKMHGDRGGTPRVDHRAFGRAHVEIQALVFCSEPWQAIQVVDFFRGQNREAVCITTHVMTWGTGCRKFTFRTGTVPGCSTTSLLLCFVRKPLP